MSNQQQIQDIIAQAKQQRAEFIGASIRKHPVAALMLVAIPVLLTQIPWSPSPPVAGATYQNAPRTPMARPDRQATIVGESSATSFVPMGCVEDEASGDQSPVSRASSPASTDTRTISVIPG